MSSPGGMSRPNQYPTPEAQDYSMTNDNNATGAGVTIRDMRLKVLYTFDDQNTTNCLARWPHILKIQTVAMDETTSIGVIDLKTCIQAVVQCSPELVARLGQDYTVYAYDCSEYDTPLVGQGMLSWALAAASPTLNAPAHQSRQLITGRVFKLRLVPVPTVLQSDYFTSMEKYKELSKVVPPGFDNNEWLTFLQSNPRPAQVAAKVAAPSPDPSNHRNGMSMEDVNQLLSPSIQPQNIDTLNHPSNVEQSGNESKGSAKNENKARRGRPSSRAPTKRQKPRGRPPKSSASVGGNTSGYEEGTDGDDGPVPKKRAKITQTDWNSKSAFGPASNSLRVAATTAGSLHFRPIAMSPGPNVGGHLQEIPRAPTPIPSSQNLARGGAPPQSCLRRGSFESPLGDETDIPRKHVSPYPTLEPTVAPEDQVRYSIESANASPEKNSPTGSLQDIGSSPPVVRSSPPCQSSPVLPQMPRTDSGFMSGSLDDLFGEGDEAMQPIDDEDLAIAANYSRRRAPPPEIQTPREFIIEEETPGPVELLPTRMPVIERRVSKAASKQLKSRTASVVSEDGQTLPPLRHGSRSWSHGSVSAQSPVDNAQNQAYDQPQPEALQQEFEAVVNALLPVDSQPASTHIAQPLSPAPPQQSGSRMMLRTASVGSLSLPTVAIKDPTMPPSQLTRSQTWSDTPHRMTEVLAPTKNAEAPYTRTFNSKKAIMKQRLETAIANGEMPPYCENCGAIETPTWRKAWLQEHQGAPGYYEYSDKPGCVTAIIILSRDDDGNPTSHQLIKKFLAPTEQQKDYRPYVLCNRKLHPLGEEYMKLTVVSACGIWLSKYKSQRPEEKWENNRTAPALDANGVPEKKKRSKPRPSRAKKPNAKANLNSEANYPQSEGYYLQSEANVPPESNFPTEMAGAAFDPNIQVQRVELPSSQLRASSVHPTKHLAAMTSDAASAALKRAIQSSPARSRWGTQTSPIDLDDDMGPTRRLLFPSPRKDGSPKVLKNIPANIQMTPPTRSQKTPTADLSNKENRSPAFETGDDDTELIKLFEEEMARPTTPIRKSPSSNPFKTPTRPTPSHRPITRSVSKSIRSAKSPSQLLALSQRTPSRTPGTTSRRSPRNHNVTFESPFTATLNQLMSEANNQESPSRLGIQLDFGNLELPNLDGDASMNFNMPPFDNEDFFSTDVPMPSSPPSTFRPYEDMMTIGNDDTRWNEFRTFEDGVANGVNEGGDKEVQVKVELDTEEKGTDEDLASEKYT
ncbi:hypothetical protein B7494_g1048 [Chlorociboria aeruginascens]|nr:hypothetical protein B7494_g1048 [Chlorociboria aeruginascens]